MMTTTNGAGRRDHGNEEYCHRCGFRHWVDQGGECLKDGPYPCNECGEETIWVEWRGEWMHRDAPACWLAANYADLEIVA